MEVTHIADNGLSGHRHVVALPYPGRGHINPMLCLCRLLASRGLLVTVVVTEEWLGLLSSSPPLTPNLRLRAIPDVLPSELTRGADIHAFTGAVLTKMEAPVEELLAGLDPPVDAIVADALLPWAPAIGGRRGIPVSALFPQSAAVFLAVLHLAEVDGDGQSAMDHSGKTNEYLKYAPIVPSTYFTKFLANSNSQSILRYFMQVISWSTTAQSLLFTSFHELESHFINTLKSKLTLPIYPIGPSIPYTTYEAEDSTHSYFKWLDSQPKGSVLYISLGSYLPISSDQMVELALGIQMSKTYYLWVARGESQRLKELSGDIGLVLPWCNQLQVLCHPSIGGFLTHCGWNSTMEAVFAGVPMLTFPLMWDQYPNSKLIVEDWNIGLSLKEEKEEGFIGREKIAKVVSALMDLDSKENKELRREAILLKEICRKALVDNGSSSANIDTFVQNVQRQKLSETISNA